MIYIVGEKCTGIVKIGFATNPYSRLPSLQVGSAVKLNVLAIVPGELQHERWLHRYFNSRRMHGEWFNFDNDNAVTAVVRAWLEIADKDSEQLHTELLPDDKGPRWSAPLDGNGDACIFVGRQGEYDWYAPKEMFEP